LYGVWAAETNGHPLIFDGATLRGSKMFCTGADFLDRALITAEGRLLDVSLRASAETISIDTSVWKTGAFAEARTATVTFDGTPVDEDNVICGPNWYIDRPGFWQGACGPSACWAGGAIALLDYALRQSRNDSHTLAHLAAMDADVWGLRAYLECAGNQIDAQPKDWRTAQKTALRMRHLIEQACVDILTRLGRAYGPRPLAFDETISRRYQELELYIRQCHAERDLEVLGSLLQSASSRGRAVFQEIA
jgi:alkylation response protein AidB-like acyl-CoA dehydrogenase